MAKARRISGLNKSDPYSSAAAKIVGVRVGELLDHARGVLDVEDIKRVHDMRVATRRLRAALEIFGPCFPERELKAALRQVKSLADALGERRDRDVAIDALETITGSMAAPDRLGIETLIVRLRAEQATANEALARFVTQDNQAARCEQLTELVANAQPTLAGDGEAEALEAAWLPRRVDAANNGAGMHAVGEGV